MLDDLRASRDGYGIHWMKFLKLLTANRESVVCVFEGEDSKYYGTRLDNLAEVNWIPLKAGGRANVIKIFDLSKSRNDCYERSYFFIDRDFDEAPSLKSDSRLYVTPDYSIENLYCSDDALTKILRDEFSCPSNGTSDNDEVENQSCHRSILSDFRASRASFLSLITDINAWIVCNRRRESMAPGSGRLNLGNFNIANYVTVDLLRCESDYELTNLNGKFCDSEMPSEEDFDRARAFLHTRSLESTCRGKFLAFFMRSYIGKLKADAAAERPRLVINKTKPKLSLSDKNFLSELTQYADTPTCLKSFMIAMKRVN